MSRKLIPLLRSDRLNPLLLLLDGKNTYIERLTSTTRSSRFDLSSNLNEFDKAICLYDGVDFEVQGIDIEAHFLPKTTDLVVPFDVCSGLPKAPQRLIS